jgi:hypothetical protein
MTQGLEKQIAALRNERGERFEALEPLRLWEIVSARMEKNKEEEYASQTS